MAKESKTESRAIVVFSPQDWEEIFGIKVPAETLDKSDFPWSPELSDEIDPLYEHLASKEGNECIRDDPERVSDSHFAFYALNEVEGQRVSIKDFIAPILHWRFSSLNESEDFLFSQTLEQGWYLLRGFPWGVGIVNINNQSGTFYPEPVESIPENYRITSALERMLAYVLLMKKKDYLKSQNEVGKKEKKRIFDMFSYQFVDIAPGWTCDTVIKDERKCKVAISPSRGFLPGICHPEIRYVLEKQADKVKGIGHFVTRR